MEKLIGNAIVGQSGGPTAAINATLAGVIKGAFDNDCIETIYGAFNAWRSLLYRMIPVPFLLVTRTGLEPMLPP